eukprot:scaffold7375_cov268-Pinguiococcus_pyrenoidosus.AAC.40
MVVLRAHQSSIASSRTDTLDGNRFAEVLDRLRFPRARRPLWRPAIQQPDGADHRAVAAIRKRRDDKAHAVAQVLVAVENLRVHDPRDDRRVSRLDSLAILPARLPVVAQLSHPAKVRHGLDALLHHAAHRISRVHLGVQALLKVAQRRRPAALDGCGHVSSPVDLADAQNDLRRPVQHPLRPGGVLVVLQSLHRLGTDALPLHFLQLVQPAFHAALVALALGVDGLVQSHLLAFATDHHGDLEVVLKLHLVHALEGLAQVRLHRARLLGLRQDLQQLVVGQEEEAREVQTLDLQVVAQALLDQLQLLVGRLELAEQALVGMRLHDEGGVGLGLLHGLAPQGVHVLEAPRLGRELAHDVFAAEDGLQIQPGALHGDPLIQHALRVLELELPRLGVSLDGLDEGRAAHGLGLHDVVVQQRDDVVHASHDAAAGLVRYHLELLGGPLLHHRCQRIGQTELLLGGDADALDVVEEVGDVEVQQRFQRQIVVGFNGLADLVAQKAPVARLQGGRRQALDDRKVLAEGGGILAQLRRTPRRAGMLRLQCLGELVRRLPPLGDLRLDLRAVEQVERPGEPLVAVGEEVVCHGPQLDEGRRLLLHGRQGVLGGNEAKDLLSHVHVLCAFAGLSKFVHEGVGYLKGSLPVAVVVQRLDLRHLGVEGVEEEVELLLVQRQLVHHLALLPLEALLRFSHGQLDARWALLHRPRQLRVSVAEAEVELRQAVERQVNGVGLGNQAVHGLLPRRDEVPQRLELSFIHRRLRDALENGVVALQHALRVGLQIVHQQVDQRVAADGGLLHQQLFGLRGEHAEEAQALAVLRFAADARDGLVEPSYFAHEVAQRLGRDVAEDLLVKLVQLDLPQPAILGKARAERQRLRGRLVNPPLETRFGIVDPRVHVPAQRISDADVEDGPRCEVQQRHEVGVHRRSASDDFHHVVHGRREGLLDLVDAGGQHDVSGVGDDHRHLQQRRGTADAEGAADSGWIDPMVVEHFVPGADVPVSPHAAEHVVQGAIQETAQLASHAELHVAHQAAEDGGRVDLNVRHEEVIDVLQMIDQMLAKRATPILLQLVLYTLAMPRLRFHEAG